MKRQHQLAVGQLVGDHHQVDVAARRVVSLGDGPVQEAGLDAGRERRKRFSQRLGQAERLADNGNQLVMDRRIGVGPVSLLVAYMLDGQQSAAGEPGQLALDGAAAGARGLDQFVDGIAAPGLAEQTGQDALLGGGEQGPGQTGGGIPRRGLADLAGTDGIVHAHIGHDNAQIGQAQAQVMSACESACIS